MSEQTTTQQPLRCFLLGEEPLLQRCAELILGRGHVIVGVVTNTSALEGWAKDHGIPTFRRGAYEAWLEGQPIDVLLSITHPALIREATIGKARLAALNYHDGPLPRYAGMNGSAWALHNGESAHAIVWHHLTSGLDTGDIVERRDVVFEPRETSLSLNMKNSALALESFERVLDRLESGNIAGTPQATDVERTVFSRHDRPRALSTIDWQARATSADQLVRACAFGQFPNRFGAAKLVHRGVALIVREAEVGPQPKPAPRPGMVIELGEHSISIACGDGALRITGFSTLTGATLTARQAALELRLRQGEILAEGPRSEWEGVTDAIARAEPAFVRRLSQRDIPSLPFGSGNGLPACVPLALPREFVERCQGQLHEATAALFAFTLSCLLREDSITVALTNTAHQAPALAPLCSVALPWDVRIDASQSFAELLLRMRSEQSKLLEGPSFLLDLIAREPALRNQDDLRRGSVSNVAVVLGNAAVPPGAQLGIVVSDSGSALVSDGSIALEDVTALAARMRTVATNLDAAWSSKLGRVDCLSAEERQRQVYDWNATERPFPSSLRIADLFEQRALEQPDAVALVFRGKTMTFAEVERAANRVANAVRAAGVTTGQYVGVIVERSFELVIALLGIAKSGAAYVPVDTIYPPDRAEFMLEDTACRVVLASSELVHRCGDRHVIIVDGPEVRGASDERRPCPAQSTDVCYTIFTSGSTGKPKGVVLTHRAVVNTLDWVNREFGVTPADRLLFVTSPSFDLSVYDVFGALGAGASIEIASRELLAEPEGLTLHVCTAGITIWDSAPPALARLAPFLPSAAPESRLRLVMLSGDWIPVTLPDHLMRVFPGVKVKSLGGATEAAIWSNYHHVDAVDPAWVSIPYGKPIQNARYYILDHHLRAIPAGLTGDLYIGGVCLAEGYLNRPELTAERFIPDPFVENERIYKTGDLSRFWDDGTMEFLGRADFQVKIRGFRVEIGEVEAALAAQPGVRMALCTAYVDASGQKALVAYVQPKQGVLLDETVLKQSLAVNLPDYMVPGFILFLDAFPLSSNGKIDRKALPPPEQKRTRTEYATPTTPLQRQLVEIWQQVMKRDPIGIDDNFFELGGHSLMAVSLVTRIRSELGLELTLSRVLERPTVRSLAAAYDNRATTTAAEIVSEQESTVIELRAGGPRRFFFVYDGEGETLLYLNLAKRLPEGFAVSGIMPRSRPGIPLAHASVEDMAAFAIKQMKTYQPKGPYYLGGLCAGGVVSYEMTVQLERAGEQVGGLVLLEAFEPKATARRGVTAQRRMDRFKRVFVNGEQSMDFGAMMRARTALVRKVATKVASAASYELSSRIGEATIAARLRVLDRILETGGEWPVWLSPLSTRDIYIWVRAKYAASPIKCKNVILVKAVEAIPGVRGDQPTRELYVEPLFGWEPYVEEPIIVLDVSGGHSSMLQEPYVEDLAAKLSPHL
jgi:amino acid adenylation domain-containing protein